MTKPEERVLHIRVSEDTHKFLRVQAALLDISVTEYVTRLLDKDKERKERK